MASRDGAAALHIPLGESPQETERKKKEREASFHPPENDNTWYADGENWHSTRTPWD